MLKGLGPKTIQRLSYENSPDPDRIYLYNDECNPIKNKASMDVYLERLEILAKLRTQ